MPKLSILILSFNTKDITIKCLNRLIGSLSNILFEVEIIIVDNASTDGSQSAISNIVKKFESKNVELKNIFNTKNTGYTKGNNQGMRNANGKYILFLNSDVIIDSLDWDKLLNFLDENPQIGALSVRVNLSSGALDKASHRGFPTIWNSFCYYTKLESITRRVPFINKIFGGYHMIYSDLSKIHEIDSPSGAFYLAPKKILDELNGFDERFFMYGEDLDLSYRLKSKGYKVVFYPLEKVIHLKYQSGFKNKILSTQTKMHFFQAMKIFYQKHYEQKNPVIVNRFIYLLIYLKSRL